jgi:DNA-binding response OmpR family regulator
LLGYNYQDFSQNNDLTCGNREPSSDCRNIQVTFLDTATAQQQFPLAGWFFTCILAIGLFYLSQKIVANTKNTNEANENTFTSFGQSRFDFTNQVLICGTITHTLTYREAKLLNLFAQHQNLVLERSFILENVWADEGILVGRSLDMFVSRLRKMLRDDASIQLIAVHGVGYRLEILKS